jgi:hypothetical protein
MKTTKYAIIAAAALILAGSGALAQQRAVVKACAADIKSLCADVKPGEGRVRDCVKSHFGELSAPCQDVVTKVAAIGKACKADVKQFCADVKPGGGRIETCMKTHLSEVSDPCKDALSTATAGKS